MSYGEYGDQASDSDIASLVALVLKTQTFTEVAESRFKAGFCVAIERTDWDAYRAYWEYLESVERGTIQWDATAEFVARRMRGKGR